MEKMQWEMVLLLQVILILKTRETVNEASFDIFFIDKDNRKSFANRYGAGISKEFIIN